MHFGNLGLKSRKLLLECNLLGLCALGFALGLEGDGLRCLRLALSFGDRVSSP